MKPSPATYAEWVELLHRFERSTDDQEVVAILGRSKFSLPPEMAQRLCKRVVEVVEGRVRVVVTHLQQDLDRGTDEVGYGQSMTRARHELAPIAGFCAAACWPPDFGAAMKKSLDDFVAKTRASLEESAAAYARHDQGARLSMIRKFPFSIGVPAAEPPGGSRSNPKPPPDDPLPTRRIIL